MKYLNYISILLDKLFGKGSGVPLFYLLKDKRGYARNRVYNYVLQNNIYLPRLLEMNWTLKDGLYTPQNKSDKKFTLKDKAYLVYNKVSWLEYQYAKFIWKYFDDDSNYDTHDGIPEDETKDIPFGRAFDLGDLRKDYPVFDKDKTWYWITRNSYYNANYLNEEIREDDKNNFYYFTKKEHWTPTLEKWNNIPYIKFYKSHWHFGYIPYENSERKGRLIYFTEDINRVDEKIKLKYKK